MKPPASVGSPLSSLEDEERVGIEPSALEDLPRVVVAEVSESVSDGESVAEADAESKPDVAAAVGRPLLLSADVARVGRLLSP